MLRPITLTLALLAAPLAAPLPSLAQSGEAQVILPDTQLSERAPEIRQVFADFGLYDILQIMSVEGMGSAAGMEADMFPGRGGSAWPAVVAGVYATDRLVRDFETAVPVDLLPPDTVAEVQAFVESDLGQRIVAGEIAARRAFLDPDVEATANDMVAEGIRDGAPRLEILRDFIEVYDLLDRNVAGALNSNFAFFRGLADGDGLAVEMPEDLMLAEVWGQEAEIRASTTEWLLSYQLTAYADLSDEDMQAYVDFGRTEAGQALNRALFAAFDVMFEQVSYDLGQAAAVFIAGEDT